MDIARFPARVGLGVRDVLHGDDAVAALDTSGCWAVVATFEGEVTAVRFSEWTDVATPPSAPRSWRLGSGEWTSSLTESAYLEAVREVRRRVAAGTVYQVNICRVLTHELDAASDLSALAERLAGGNPAPYAAHIHVAAAGLDLVSASPELFVSRDGDRVVSGPIKGTAAPGERMLDKDYAENVMITDLVRNDLSHVCRAGSVDVESLCALDEHPGLTHLTTHVAGRLREGKTWADILEATFPPGSVSGAPKSTALEAIADLEPVARGPYCGAVGWVDADSGTAELAVGIRTFWSDWQHGRRWLRFGTGAGITWGSDPQAEWAETELKARRLIGLASRDDEGRGR